MRCAHYGRRQVPFMYEAAIFFLAQALFGLGIVIATRVIYVG
jgi:hypothetical protein